MAEQKQDDQHEHTFSNYVRIWDVVQKTLPLIHTLYCWVLSKEVSSTIFKVFGMTRPGIEKQ